MSNSNTPAADSRRGGPRGATRSGGGLSLVRSTVSLEFSRLLPSLRAAHRDCGNKLDVPADAAHALIVRTMFPKLIQQSDLLALAPTVLRNARVKRYHGDNLAIAISEFVENDQSVIRKLYAFLQGLFATLLGLGAERAQALQSFLADHRLESVVDQVGELGPASYAARPSALLAKTIHDVRGGGLTPLIGQLQLWKLHERDPSACDALYFLTRDHLKIMRNALLGLDDLKRNEDLEIKIHDTDFIVEKWNGALLGTGAREVRLEVTCPQPVPISECCVEFGALDRILYNLLNNACRHVAGTSIQLVLFPVPDEHGENLRFVLLNALTSADAEHLRGIDLQTLFHAGVSTTGSGYGLNVAADFVANAFGLATPEEAVAGRYIGAKVLRGQFAIWFHWPIVAEY